MKTVTLFNNKGGVGKTTLLYHIAWMCSELGFRTLVVDLDPQSNLTSMFLDDSELESIWPDEGPRRSVQTCVQPIIDGVGDIAEPPVIKISNSGSRLHLVPGDLRLSLFEDILAHNWPLCLDQKQAAFRVMSSFYRIARQAAAACDAQIVLLDVGPNLGALNRAALVATDYVVTPLSPGLFSLQGLKNLGPTLMTWRREWSQRLSRMPAELDIPMPQGRMWPIGYLIAQHSERKNRPVQAFQRWIEPIPAIYSKVVLAGEPPESLDQDPHRIDMIKNYQSLIPMSESANKPVFHLKPADGAIGAHATAVTKCYSDFKRVTLEILKRMDTFSKENKYDSEP